MNAFEVVIIEVFGLKVTYPRYLPTSYKTKNYESVHAIENKVQQWSNIVPDGHPNSR